MNQCFSKAYIKILWQLSELYSSWRRSKGNSLGSITRSPTLIRELYFWCDVMLYHVRCFVLGLSLRHCSSRKTFVDWFWNRFCIVFEFEGLITFLSSSGNVAVKIKPKIHLERISKMINIVSKPALETWSLQCILILSRYTSCSWKDASLSTCSFKYSIFFWSALNLIFGLE